MIIGIAYDTKEDYSLNGDASFFDFSTLAEVSNLKKAIESCGHKVLLLGSYKRITSLIAQNEMADIDIVFNMCEGIGSRNREGLLPALMEANGIPYTGTDTYGLCLSLNKIHSKIIAEYLKINTPRYFVIEKNRKIIPDVNIQFPLVVKPAYEGTSSGVTLVRNQDELLKITQSHFRTFGQPIICEEYIDGREFTVSLIGSGISTKPVGIIETIRKNKQPIGIYSCEDKMKGHCERSLPSDLPDTIKKQAFEWAVKLHNFIGCMDINRVDYRMDKNGTLYFLELNPLPGFSSTSAFPECCRLNSILFKDAINEVINSAAQRYSIT